MILKSLFRRFADGIVFQIPEVRNLYGKLYYRIWKESHTMGETLPDGRTYLSCSFRVGAIRWIEDTTSFTAHVIKDMGSKNRNSR